MHWSGRYTQSFSAFFLEKGLRVFGLFLMRSISRLIIFSYALLIIKPVMPVVIDDISHAFWASYHYRVVHKEHGKEHVHYELRKMAKENEKDKLHGKYKADQDEVVYAINPEIVAIPTSKLLKYCAAVYADYVCAYYYPFHELDYPPPKSDSKLVFSLS